MNPQAGIFVENTPEQLYLEYSLDAAMAAPLRQSLAGIMRLATRSSSHLIVAFGSVAYQTLAGHADLDCPQGLRDFEELRGTTIAAATQRDLFFWIHGHSHGDNFDLARTIHEALLGQATLSLEQRGFVYHDSRDLIGFIDGTENPHGEKARDAALIPAGEPGAGGSFVLTQQWVSNVDAFNKLATSEQEQVVGRTKVDSIELEGSAMPPDSHVSRTDAKVDGVAQKIYRRSAPYGNVQVHGLYFLAFAKALGRFDIQLQRMFGLAGDGLHDRLTEFSVPVTGSYWFAPPANELERLLA